jgi:hypothetical protein
MLSQLAFRIIFPLTVDGRLNLLVELIIGLFRTAALLLPRGHHVVPEGGEEQRETCVSGSINRVSFPFRPVLSIKIESILYISRLPVSCRRLAFVFHPDVQFVARMRWPPPQEQSSILTL